MNAVPSPASPIILKEHRKQGSYRLRELTPDPSLPPYSVPLGKTIRTSSGPTTCEGTHRIFDCPDGHERRIRYLGDGKYDCSDCERSNNTKRAAAAWRKISRVRGAVWGVFVFTFPDYLRELLTPKILDRLRKRAWKLIELFLARENGIRLEWGREAGCEGWLFGALEFTHPTGDRFKCRACDWSTEGGEYAYRMARRHEEENEAHEVVKTGGDRWKPHFNFLVPMVSSAGGKSLQYYWRDQAIFDRLFAVVRRAWRRELSREFGPIEGEVNLKYEYRRERGKKMHAVRYFARVFPGWSCAGLRARSFGYLSDRCLREAAWEWDQPEKFHETSPSLCSVCGKELLDSGTTDAASATEIRESQRLERRRNKGAA